MSDILSRAEQILLDKAVMAGGHLALETEHDQAISAHLISKGCAQYRIHDRISITDKGYNLARIKPVQCEHPNLDLDEGIISVCPDCGDVFVDPISFE